MYIKKRSALIFPCMARVSN